MADETNAPEATPAPEERGLPAGVDERSLNSGEVKTGDGIPKAPEIVNTPPEKTPEEKAKIAEAEAAANTAKAAEDAANKEPEKTPEDEKAALEAEIDNEPDLPDDYDYGDEVANSAASLMKEAGVDPKVAQGWFQEAVDTGDMSKIKVDEMVKAMGKEKANLVVLGVKDYYTRTIAAATEKVKAVYDACGGEANWAKIRSWAKSKAGNDQAFAKQIEAYTKMFDLNAVAAASAARELVSAYERDAGNSGLNTKMVHGDAPASQTGVAGETLTRAQYMEKIKVAEDKRDYKEANRLRAIRLASKRNGIN